MSLIAQNVDARKKYMWALEITTPFGPENIAKIVECDPPDSEVEPAEYNSAGTLHSIKQPGRRKFKPINFKKLMVSTGSDRLIYVWFEAAANTTTGRGLRPSLLKRDVDLLHLSEEGAVIERWTLKGAWISAISHDRHEGGSSDFLYEMGTITYDRFERKAA